MCIRVVLFLATFCIFKVFHEQVSWVSSSMCHEGGGKGRNTLRRQRAGVSLKKLRGSHQALRGLSTGALLASIAILSIPSRPIRAQSLFEGQGRGLVQDLQIAGGQNPGITVSFSCQSDRILESPEKWGPQMKNGLNPTGLHSSPGGMC